MTLQYTAVGIQNESHMALTIDDYWTDLKALAFCYGFFALGLGNAMDLQLVRGVHLAKKAFAGPVFDDRVAHSGSSSPVMSASWALILSSAASMRTTAARSSG